MYTALTSFKTQMCFIYGGRTRKYTPGQPSKHRNAAVIAHHHAVIHNDTLISPIVLHTRVHAAVRIQVEIGSKNGVEAAASCYATQARRASGQCPLLGFR